MVSGGRALGELQVMVQSQTDGLIHNLLNRAMCCTLAEIATVRRTPSGSMHIGPDG
jgi:hypothetical protein